MEQPNTEMLILQDPAKIMKTLRYLLRSDDKYIAVDIETDSIEETRANLYGIGLCCNDTEACYLNVQAFQEEELNALFACLIEVFKAKHVIMHNAVYDCSVLSRLSGYDFHKLVYCDTMLLKHTAISEEHPFGLKELAVRYLGAWANQSQKELHENIKKNGGKTTKTQMDMYKADPDILGRYCCFDVLLTLLLFKHFSPTLEADGLTKFFYEEEVMPLCREVVVPMKMQGIHIDVAHFKRLNEQIQAEQERLNKEIHEELRDDSINLNSTAQLSSLFFDKLGEKPLSQTKGGKNKVDAAFLESVAETYNWVRNLLLLKKLSKLQSTYIEGILRRQINGKIHTSMLQFGTTSGRFSSSNPNLQNLPRVKEEDSGLPPLVLKYSNAIREGFIAPPGYLFVDADYSALEPRCFAAASRDKDLQRIFHIGEDMYSAIAIKSFGLKDMSSFKEDVNYLGKKAPEKRQQVKTMALAVTYGAQAFRISKLLKVSRKEAESLIKRYFAAYPGLKEYIRDCHATAMTTGKVKNKFGRVRHLPEVKGKSIYEIESDYNLRSKLNNATNFPIQSLAASIVNRAMIEITRRFKVEGVEGYVALQIHDQITCAVKRAHADKAVAIMRDVMQNNVKIEVPLIAEPKKGSNLSESH